jgi:hypothetical protein
MTDPDLVAAARFEIESRERHYPALIQSQKMTAEAATVDFQAWHCIAQLLETGTFTSIDAGGADGTTRVGWQECVKAADQACASTAQAIAAAKGDDAKVKRLTARLDALRAIARRVGRMARLVAGINEEFRARRKPDPAPAKQPDAEEFRKRHQRRAA